MWPWGSSYLGEEKGKKTTANYVGLFALLIPTDRRLLPANCAADGTFFLSMCWRNEGADTCKQLCQKGLPQIERYGPSLA